MTLRDYQTNAVQHIRTVSDRAAIQGRFIDAVIQHQRLRNDAALSRLIGMSPANLSRVRHGVNVVGATMILAVHEKTDMPVARIRALLGGAA